MAADFLKSHGIDLDAELAAIQKNVPMGGSSSLSTRTSITQIRNVSLPRTEKGSRWDISIRDGFISQITVCDQNASATVEIARGNAVEGYGALLTTSLCHPHIHIDKAYLLSHPKYSHLQMQRGDFAEAMELTGQAKGQFEEWDLLERGQRVIDESVAAGVTHMRAFVEVDAGVGNKCLDAGIKLRQKAEIEERNCSVQLVAFAQLPLFTPSPNDEEGAVIRELMSNAAKAKEIDVVGSTPYVEADRQKAERNVKWMVDLSIEENLHLDFHLDYHLDATKEPLVWYVIQTLKEKKWAARTQARTVVLGHCTRLTLFASEEWRRLREEIGSLPISFVGLPTSDLFMMRTPEGTRGTLIVTRMIEEDGLNACLGVNNIGNAFTPHGSCDPLTLACNGVAVYQAGTERDAEVLFECVSGRAKKAIGMLEDDGDVSARVREGDRADILLLGTEREEWRMRMSIAEAVYLYDSGRGRKSILGGVQTNMPRE